MHLQKNFLLNVTSPLTSKHTTDHSRNNIWVLTKNKEKILRFSFFYIYINLTWLMFDYFQPLRIFITFS